MLRSEEEIVMLLKQVWCDYPRPCNCWIDFWDAPVTGYSRWMLLRRKWLRVGILERVIIIGRCTNNEMRGETLKRTTKICFKADSTMKQSDHWVFQIHRVSPSSGEFRRLARVVVYDIEKIGALEEESNTKGRHHWFACSVQPIAFRQY